MFEKNVKNEMNRFLLVLLMVIIITCSLNAERNSGTKDFKLLEAIKKTIALIFVP